VAESPEDARACLNLGLAEWRLERYEEARIHLREFLELAPEDPQAPEVRRLLEAEGR
jgi:Flp pilus assembly protein TadD